MKKILSFLAACAITIGLISCSGDLHEVPAGLTVDLSAGAVPGGFNNWTNTTAWSTISEDKSVYTYKFIASDSTVEWKAITLSGEWNSGAYGETEIKLDGTESKLVYDGGTGGGKNSKITGLTKSLAYKLTVRVDVLDVYAKVESDDIPEFFLLDSYYLKGSFNEGWKFDEKQVLMDGVKNTDTGDVTYTVMFIATAETEEGMISKFNDNNSFYKAVKDNDTVSAKDGKEITLSTSSDGTGNIKFSDLEVGKGYFVNVVTSVDKTVKISIKEAASIQIIGVQVVGLNNADYEGKTFIFGGGQIGWPSKWDGSEAATTVKNGVATLKLETPKKLYETGTKITIMGTVEGNWNSKIASLYKQNDGNSDGSIDISKFAIDYTDYIIYADVTGLKSGDKVEWKLVKPTVTVSVTGLPVAANGKELYFTGDFNGWKEPGKEGSYKVTVADGSISLVASVDAKSSGKFAAAGWTKPEICALKADGSDADNISWDGLSFGKTLKGVYSKTLTKDNGDVYICNWTVE